jgi:histidyl-tRNA synthetase
MGEVFRDGPIKAGRFREFWQCDADIVGSNSMMADAEVINLMLDVFNELGIKVVIKVNNRKLLNALLVFADVQMDKYEDTILAIDKLDKIGVQGVKSELKEKGVSEESIKKIMGMIGIKSIEEIKKKIGENEGIKEIEELFSYVKNKNVVFDLSLARGMSYYTGTIFEAVLKDSEFGDSVAGGGRYDEMIGNYLGGGRRIPAVGVSFGLSRIMSTIKTGNKQTNTQVYVIPIGKPKAGLDVVGKLRKAGVNADVDIIGRGISKNLDYANSLGIPYVIFVGEKEIKEKKVKLRDMKTGKEKNMDVEKVGKLINFSS